MTLQERMDPAVMNGSRRSRIARGSGTSIQDVNKLVKQFAEVRKMVKAMAGGGRGGRGKIGLPGGMKLPPGMGV